MLNARLSLSIVLGIALAGAVSPELTLAATTTINGALGDLDGDGDGGAAEAAIVQAGAACWDARIATNRNFTLTVSGASLTGRGVGATTAINGGVPTAGFIQMDNDGSVTWFVDPTPLRSLEFTPDPNAQWRFINGTAASGANNADLMRSVMHEMGHAHGWICGNASCNRTPNNFNFDGLMVPQPANFTANTNVNLVANPGFNVPLRGDGVAGGIGVGGIVNELSHTGPSGPSNAVADMMFGRTGNAVRETHSLVNVDMFARAYGDTTNFPPTINAGADVTEECSEPGGSTISLDGSGSTDPDADGLSYSWTCANVVLSDTNTVTPDGFFPNGTTEQCRLDATDLAACPDDADLVNVTVVDTTAPSLTVPADIVAECTSPNGTPVDIGTAVAVDACDSFVPVSNDDPGIFPLGDTTVEWTAVDDDGNVSTDSQLVTVQDTTPPEIFCNAPATIIPPDAPISFVATATDVCDTNPDFEITAYDCFKFTKKGKRINKTGSCEVAIGGDTVTILDSGGVDDHIEWTVVATDANGNVSEETCAVLVVNPGKGKP